MRRTFALAPSMISLIVVALFAHSAGIAAPLAGEVNAALAAPARACDRRPARTASVRAGWAGSHAVPAHPSAIADECTSVACERWRRTRITVRARVRAANRSTLRSPRARRDLWTRSSTASARRASQPLLARHPDR
jgi:hypothetical protein